MRKTHKWAFLVCLLVGLGSCDTDNIKPEASENQGVKSITPIASDHAATVSFNKNLQKWLDKGSNTYHYTYQRSCFCPRDYVRPLRATVKSGAISKYRYADTSQPVPEEIKLKPETIVGVFKLIRQAISRNAASITTSYDPVTGAPLRVVVDYDKRMADEELYITLSDIVLK